MLLVAIAGCIAIAVGISRQDNSRETMASLIAELIQAGVIQPGSVSQLANHPDIVEIDISGLDAEVFANLGPYQPDPEMTGLIDQLNLTGPGREILLDSRPEFASRAEMGSVCPGADVRGCYVRYTRGRQKVRQTIFILANLGPDINIEVAAHELLHAAYDSMPDKGPLNGLLDTAYQDNRTLIDHRLEPYGELSSYSRYTETHSFAGSLVRDLPPGLEGHYRQYFNNRANIVDRIGIPQTSRPEPRPEPEPPLEPQAPAAPTTPTPTAPRSDPGEDCRNAGGDWTGQTCDYRRRDCQVGGGSWFGDSCDRPSLPTNAEPEPEPETSRIGQEILGDLRELLTDVRTSQWDIRSRPDSDLYDCQPVLKESGSVSEFADQADRLARMVERVGVYEDQITPTELGEIEAIEDVVLEAFDPIQFFIDFCLDRATRARLIFVEKPERLLDNMQETLEWVRDSYGDCDEIRLARPGSDHKIIDVWQEKDRLLALYETSDLTGDDLFPDDQVRSAETWHAILGGFELIIDLQSDHSDNFGCNLYIIV